MTDSDPGESAEQEASSDLIEGLGWLDGNVPPEEESYDGPLDDEVWRRQRRQISLTKSELRHRFAIEEALRTLGERLRSREIHDQLASLSRDLREIFQVERAAVFVLDQLEDRLHTEIQVSEGRVESLRFALGSSNIPGYVAATGGWVALEDARDPDERHKIHPDLGFDSVWDELEGATTRQLLALPILNRSRIEGVVVLINSARDQAFERRHRKSLREITEALSLAFVTRKVPTVCANAYAHLLSEELLLPDQLEEAKAVARRDGDALNSVLLGKFRVAKGPLLHSLSLFHRAASVTYDSKIPRPDQALLGKFSRDYLAHHGFCPISDDGTRVVIAAAKPQDLVLRDQVTQLLSGQRVLMKVAIEEDVLRFIDRFYEVEQEGVKAPGTDRRSRRHLRSLLGEIEVERQEREERYRSVNESEESAGDEDASSLIRLVNEIIEAAHKRGASDIHIEPSRDRLVCVRFRVDGVCHEFSRFPGHLGRPLLSRLKIMAGLNISERRLPQDGKIQFRRFGPLDVELRLATLPTTGGQEDCVMRLLASSKPLPLGKMGFMPEVEVRFTHAIEQPYGLVLVVGPTGSGKTTTLHSALGFINTPNRKIWTAEDPVEITQEGLRQVQIHPRIGLTFPRALRAFLRADPDVIMIGEMRDEETAEAAIEASLTGHLVLSTLHTNSAPETLTRLLDLGLDPFSFGDSLLGVLAQRLVRTFCSRCRSLRDPKEGELEGLRREFGQAEIWDRLQLGEAPQLAGAAGCDYCSESGYRGRMGIHEFMEGTDSLRSLIYRKAKIEELRAHAGEQGMTTLKQDGVRKVLAGSTDIREVRRICLR